MWHSAGMRALLVLMMSMSLVKAEKLHITRTWSYSGMSDASGAVALTTNLLAVADDETDALRIYRNDQPGSFVKKIDVSAHLNLDPKSPEADLEGAARIGDRIFWIGSHGRNKNGKVRHNRGCFFATDINTNGNDVDLTFVGQPCKTLLEAMIADPNLAQFHLAEAAQRAPKDKGGLNIEGLSATPDGHLLIGFRNPIPDKKSLLIPLLNPNEVIFGKPPKFGKAILLDLENRGIRDIAYYSGSYIIIAGSHNESADFEIYKWDGIETAPRPYTIKHLQDYQPEAIVIYPQFGLSEFQILSDDGTRKNLGIPNKDIKDLNQRTFRSFWLVKNKPTER